jgi:hypothetical protein
MIEVALCPLPMPPRPLENVTVFQSIGIQVQVSRHKETTLSRVRVNFDQGLGGIVEGNGNFMGITSYAVITSPGVDYGFHQLNNNVKPMDWEKLYNEAISMPIFGKPLRNLGDNPFWENP